MSVNASVLTAPALRGDNTFTGVNTFSGAVSMSSTIATTGAVTLTPTAGTSGVRTALTVTGAADTGLTASTEQLDVYLNLGRTLTWATGALTTQRAFRIAAPTLAFAGASTVTNAATFYIEAAPTALAQLDRAIQNYVPEGSDDVEWMLWIDGWGEALRNPMMRKISQELDEQSASLAERVIRHGVGPGEFVCVDPAAAAMRV